MMIAYDENDDGFTFSRTRSKKTKAQSVASAREPAPSESKAPEPVPAPARSRRKKDSLAPPPITEDDAAPKRRRSARLSGGDREIATPVPAEKPKRAKKTAEPKPSSERDDGLDLVGGDLVVEKKRDATKIALPFADTPVIKRNKEMRKGSGQGHRRSSTGLRGRRASSLIDSGTSNGSDTFSTDNSDYSAVLDEGLILDIAVPHDEVESQDFYKLIEQSLPEPRRMKQLLTWCGTRALPQKPSGNVKDISAIMAGMSQDTVDGLLGLFLT